MSSLVSMAIALSTLSTLGLTVDDIDYYRVEKWRDFYNIILMSENNNSLGNISFLPPEGKKRVNSMMVSIGDKTYSVTVYEDKEISRGTAEFKQRGETIGWASIYKDHNDNIRLKDVSPSLEQFENSFHLVMAVSKDPALIRRLKNPILLDSISGGEAFWCGVGMMGASIVLTPVGGFFYGVSCGLFADMDSWNFGGFGGGGGGSAAGSNRPKEYQVKTIWR